MKSSVRRVISRLRMHHNASYSARRRNLHMNLPPLSIRTSVGWLISEHVFRPEAVANLLAKIRQLVQCRGEECLTACYIRKFRENLRRTAMQESRRRVPIHECADRIDLNVLFFEDLSDLAKSKTTAVIFSIGYKQHSLP